MKNDPHTFAIIGAAMEVHTQLGHGFLEAVYQNAFAHELLDRAIPFQKEVSLRIHYKEKLLSCVYRADFICYQNVLVETKAISKLTGVDQAQVINQLKATGFKVGLLINFGAPSLEFQRIVFDPNRHSPDSAQSSDDSPL